MGVHPNHKLAGNPRKHLPGAEGRGAEAPFPATTQQLRSRWNCTYQEIKTAHSTEKHLCKLCCIYVSFSEGRVVITLKEKPSERDSENPGSIYWACQNGRGEVCPACSAPVGRTDQGHLPGRAGPEHIKDRGHLQRGPRALTRAQLLATPQEAK